jgi:hypothetical protein
LYFQERQSSYEEPGLISFSQIYFSTDRRGEAEAADAAAQLVAKLNELPDQMPKLAELGDASLLPSIGEQLSIAQIQAQFGPRFAETMRAQPTGVWHGPVVSGYGVHAVRINERTQPSVPDFTKVRDQVKADWLAGRQSELSSEAYHRLRDRYRVLVEGMPYSADTPEKSTDQE